MLGVFYVVGNIVFWEFIHKEHDGRPYQKNIAWGLAKMQLNLFKCITLNSFKVAMLFYMLVDKIQKKLLSTFCPPLFCDCGCRQVPPSAKKCFSWYITYAKQGKKCQ